MTSPLSFRLQRPILAHALSIAVLAASSAAASANRDSVAVIIGNKDYSKAGTFNVEYAHNDATAIRSFVINRLGFRPSNVIFQKDATLGQLRQIFGDENNPRGKLWNWSRAGRSSVFVYYSGHGAPDLKTRKAYLIPVDVDPQRASSGYSLSLLDENLAKLKQHIGPNQDLVLMLDACFSGQSGGGAIGGYSGGLVPNIGAAPTGIIRLAASQANEVANWNKERQLGLFTSVFLDAVRGDADSRPVGNADRRVEWPEIARYIKDEVSYRSRRLFGRDQTPEIAKGQAPGWRFDVGEKPSEMRARMCREEPARWAALKSQGDVAVIRQALSSFNCGPVREKVQAWLNQQETRNASHRQKAQENDRIARERDGLRRKQEELDRRIQELARRQQQAALDQRRQPQYTPPSPPSEPSRPSRNFNSLDLFSSAARPSFNCTSYGRKPVGNRHRNPQTDILCIDVNAARWDYRMGQYYRRYRSRLSRSDRRRLLKYQLNWIKSRNASCPASWSDLASPRRRAEIASCLISITQARIQQLQ